MLINFEDAVWALSCHLAVSGPPGPEETDRARNILYGALTAEQRAILKA